LKASKQGLRVAAAGIQGEGCWDLVTTGYLKGAREARQRRWVARMGARGNRRRRRASRHDWQAGAGALVRLDMFIPNGQLDTGPLKHDPFRHG